MAGFPYKPLRNVPFAKQENEIRSAVGDIVQRSEWIVAVRRGAWELRLLVLQPSGTQDAPLRGKLIRKCLNSVRDDRYKTPKASGITSYEALSYVWDDGTSILFKALGINGNIKINDLDFSITPNLHAALRRLRFRNKARVLFVDQICINQQDNAEKSFLVDKMTLIYSLCSRTVVWLGESIDESWRGVLLLKGLARMSLYGGGLNMSLPGAEDLFRSARWIGLNKLFKRRWWRRIWTIQECALAKTVEIHCGGRSLSWTELTSALTAITHLRQQQKQSLCVYGIHIEDVVDMNHTRTRVAQIRPSLVIKRNEGCHSETLLETLARYRTRKASDPRDKVFAIRRLAHDVLLEDATYSNIPDADYNRPIPQVYADVVNFCLRRGDMDILMHCREPQIIPSMPSWSPDWSDTAPEPHPFDYQNRKRLIFFYPDASIGVNGTVMQSSIGTLDRPDILGLRIRDEDCNLLRLPSNILDWIRAIKPEHPDLKKSKRGLRWAGKNSFEEALIRTLVADNREIHDLRSAFQILTGISSALATLTDGNSTAFIHTTSWNAIRKACIGRKLLFSANKRLGLAPAETRQTDVIVAFAGCSLPLMVRPQEGREATFKIVGPCYLDRAVEVRSWANSEGSCWRDQELRTGTLMTASFI